jgi:hypothetical protein
MPTPKSSSKANTTKIITDEIARTLPIAELVKLRQQRWEHATPLKEWTVSEDDGDTETYYAATVPTLPGKERPPTDPKLAAALNDPELQKIAAQVGTTVHSLLLMRELLLDRHRLTGLDDPERGRRTF